MDGKTSEGVGQVSAPAGAGHAPSAECCINFEASDAKEASVVYLLPVPPPSTIIWWCRCSGSLPRPALGAVRMPSPGETAKDSCQTMLRWSSVLTRILLGSEMSLHRVQLSPWSGQTAVMGLVLGSTCSGFLESGSIANGTCMSCSPADLN